MILMNSGRATLAARLLTVAAIAASAAVLHACGAEQITHVGPPPPPPPPPAPPPPPPPPDCRASESPNLASRRFFLARVGVSLLPFYVNAFSSVLDTARIDLKSDSTYTYVQLHRAPHSGSRGAITDSVADSGSYSLCGSQITLTSSSAGHAQFQGAATASQFSLALTANLIAGEYAFVGYQAVFALDARGLNCPADSAAVPLEASGDLQLRTLDGQALPVTLVETDVTTVSISSAVFTMRAPRYSVQAIGRTNKTGAADVVVVSDSGEVQACSGAMKIATSIVRDTAFLVESRDTLVVMPLAPDFVGYGYTDNYFTYYDPPMQLVFRPSP